MDQIVNYWPVFKTLFGVALALFFLVAAYMTFFKRRKKGAIHPLTGEQS